MFQQNEFLGEICVPLRSYQFKSTLREVAYRLSDYDQGQDHTGDIAVYPICTGVTKEDAVVHNDDQGAPEGEKSTSPAAEEPAPTVEPATADTEQDADQSSATLIDTPADKNTQPEEVTPAAETKKSDGSKRQGSSKAASKKKHHKVVTTISASTRPSKARKTAMVQKQVIET